MLVDGDAHDAHLPRTVQQLDQPTVGREGQVDFLGRGSLDVKEAEKHPNTRLETQGGYRRPTLHQPFAAPKAQHAVVAQFPGPRAVDRRRVDPGFRLRFIGLAVAGGEKGKQAESQEEQENAASHHFSVKGVVLAYYNRKTAWPPTADNR
ncbi:MAG TPA: hypothetical protein PLF80_12590, partial [Flavobacteriales bacterium]|nr:hypothetical protein [Flavobacteriales bacterium]